MIRRQVEVTGSTRYCIALTYAGQEFAALQFAGNLSVDIMNLVDMAVDFLQQPRQLVTINGRILSQPFQIG